FGLGLFGSVFITYNTLYKAKDNEFLLAMPIAPWKILFTRIAVLFGFTYLFEALAVIPGMLGYFVVGGFSAATLVHSMILLPATVLLTVALSCGLAYIVALISGHIRHKQAAIVILTLAFLTAYYVIYFRLQILLQRILEYSERIAGIFKTYLYPVYALGCGYAGEFVPMLVFSLIAAAVFALVYFVLSKTFIRLATRSDKPARVSTKKAVFKPSSVRRVLLHREFKHLTGSANYMLNAALGSFMLIVAAAALAIKGNDIYTALAGAQFGLFNAGEIRAELLGFAVAMVAGMNLVTAPSISIEGKSLWILRSMPLTTREILHAKITHHYLLTLIPAALALIAGSITLKLSAVGILSACLFVLLAVGFSANLGMVFGLKMPVLDWDNEAVAVKTGAAVGLSMLLSFAFAGVSFGVWIVLLIVTLYLGGTPDLLLLCMCAILAPAVVLIRRWIFTRGIRVFEAL
ncbi:MAG: hypothetical protein J5794_06425, partial [Lachnospiraceae bacterium]|nr:hypothetical protein [Lachnospiraceae bacterium]